MLIERLTALRKFMSKLVERTKPILKLMKEATHFKWDATCEQSFKSIKQFLASPPIHQRHDTSLPLIIYLVAIEDAVSTALVQEKEREQQPIYFVSQILQDAKKRYQNVEKMAFSLLTAAHCLRPYFQSHNIIVRTDHPVHNVLRKLDLAGRMTTWVVELSKYQIQYEPREPIKAQSLVDLAAKLQQESTNQNSWWTLHVDASSNV